jgi:hypothetical protein
MFRSEEGIGKHKCKGIENDEGQSGTICNANNGTSSANIYIDNETNYRSTIDDISVREITKGVEA